ncbi:MAG: hypothetical protein NW214_14750 [Pseudanabaenaceae cyanobacterium bins.39]|nr:hypothetical protein [Pseudanabaenaceae cyanobacterium bins.39]
MKILLSLISMTTLLLPFTQSASAYSQDPRSCADRRTQFPSNPPCNQSGHFNNQFSSFFSDRYANKDS